MLGNNKQMKRFALAGLVVMLAACGGEPSIVQVPPLVLPPPVSPPPIVSVPGMATLQWTAPTTNTNGSALVDLTGYVIAYGTDPTALTNYIKVDVGLTTYVIEPLTPGHWYFEMTAVNSLNIQSLPTSPVDKVIS